METKWLEDFLCLARTRNFSRASIERNITQPAFSRRIRSLERWLNITLFDRRTYPATLTAEGKIFRETAENILSELYHDRQQFQDRALSKHADLRIAAATTLNLNFLPYWLKSLETETAPISAHIITRSFHDMAHELTDGDIDLVLQYSNTEVPVVFENSAVESMILATEQMILVSPTDGQGNAVFDLENSEGQILPYMGYSDDGYFAMVEKMIFEKNKELPFKIRRCSESPTSEFLKRMAIVQGALTLIPQSCARMEIESGQLAQVGSETWTAELKIQVYRATEGGRPGVKRLWAAAKNLIEQ